MAICMHVHKHMQTDKHLVKREELVCCVSLICQRPTTDISSLIAKARGLNKLIELGRKMWLLLVKLAFPGKFEDKDIVTLLVLYLL